MNTNANIKSNYEIIKYNPKIEKIIDKKFGKFWEIINSRYGVILGAFATMSPLIYLTNHYINSEFFGNPVYHTSGFLSFVTFRVLDYLSTAKLIEEFDNKYFEYHIPFGETCPYLSKFPTKKELILSKKSILLNSLIGIICTINPPIGYGFLGWTPVVYMNNTKVFQRIKLWKKIGCAIKVKLNRNCHESEIECFLSKLEKNPKNIEEILEDQKCCLKK